MIGAQLEPHRNASGHRAHTVAELSEILDGGQIVMSAIEGIKGKPLSLRASIIGQQIGLAMLIALMGFVFYNDITRLLGS
jgi:hypothetical protein